MKKIFCILLLVCALCSFSYAQNNDKADEQARIITEKMAS